MDSKQTEGSADLSVSGAEPSRPPREVPKQGNGEHQGADAAGEMLRLEKMNSRSLAARTVPYYFAAAAGLVYAVGFLVEFTFMNSMGVKDSLTEPFKAKHIYIGILCLLYPASVVGLSLALLRMWFGQKTESDPEIELRRKLYPPTGVLFVFFLTAFYILVGLGRPDTFVENEPWFGLLFGLAILGPSVSGWLQKVVGLRLKLDQEAAQKQRIESEERELDKDLVGCAIELRIRLKERLLAAIQTTSPGNGSGVKAWARVNFVLILLWLIALAAGVLTTIIIVNSTDHLWQMLRQGGYLHFGLFLLAGFLGWRLDLSVQRRKKSAPETVRPVSMVVAIMLIALVYLSVVFFAATVYCYIPVYKGGGDFTTESPAVFYFEDHFSNAIPASAIYRGGTTNHILQSVPLYILQQNSSAFFVAATNHSNGPDTWRLLGRTNKPTEVLVIKREAVASYTFRQSHSAP